MATPSGINALIPLSGERINFGNAVTGAQNIALGAEAVKQRRLQTGEMEKAVADAERQAMERARMMAEFESIVRGVKKLTPLLPTSVEGVPRFVGALDERIAEIESTGGDASDTRHIRDLAQAGDFAEIRRQFDQVNQLADQMQAQRLGVKYQKPAGETADSRARLAGTPLLTRNPETGGYELQQGVLNPTGELAVQTAQISGEPVSRLGETGSEQTNRAVEQSRRSREETDRVARLNDIVTSGSSIAQGIPTLKRALTLLNQVGTGRPQAVALASKRLFGVEGADEGELSNLLGKAVLSQLRQTFGAQFTAEEGKQLANIEASFSKSVQANQRLLANALQIAQNAARRGLGAARQLEDQFAINDIEAALSLELDPEELLRQYGVEQQQTEQNVITTSSGAQVVFD